MYEGYLRYGNTEVVNVARASAYADAGCIPPGTDLDLPFVCDGLGVALGDGVYRMPALDMAPWYEEENPSTHWFGGVIPLSVTGLDGTTRQAQSVEGIGDGGTTTLLRRGVRTIAVSALLIGADADSVHAGLEWLTTALARTCNTDPVGCGGTTLEAFTTCPAPVTDTEDETADQTSHVVDPDAEWFTRDGVWTPGIDDGLFSVTDTVTEYDGGDVDTPEDFTEIDGGDTGTGDDVDFIDGGGATDLTSLGVLAPPDLFGCVYSDVYAVWTINPTGADPVRVTFGVINAQGDVMSRETTYRIIPTGGAVVGRHYPPQGDDDWRPALFVEAPGATVELDLRYRPLLDPEECLTPYRRTFTNVETIAGPTVVQTYEVDDCSDARMLQVEWTWVSNPYRYTPPRTLFTGLPTTTSGVPTVLVPGAFTSYVGDIVAADYICDRPTDPPGLCAIDPDYPTLSRPPSVPDIDDPQAPVPDGYRRRLVELSPTLVPLSGTGAAVFTFTNAVTIKRGVRVRLWGTDATVFADLDECDFTDEFTINYLPTEALLTIDSTTETVTVVCANGRTFDGKHLLRGAYGGVFEFPTLSCDRRYFLTIDNPSGSGTMTVAMALAVREG